MTADRERLAAIVQTIVDFHDRLPHGLPDLTAALAWYADVNVRGEPVLRVDGLSARQIDILWSLIRRVERLNAVEFVCVESSMN